MPVLKYMFVCRIKFSEDVQYFQFDKEGNMYVFPPGSGFTGEAKLVKPGDELFGKDNTSSINEIGGELSQCKDLNAVKSDVCSELLAKSDVSQTSSRYLFIIFL